MQNTTNINLLEVGTYNATVTSYFTAEGEEGKAGRVVIGFSVGKHRVFYTGFNSPAAMPYTAKALMALGLTEENEATFEQDVIGNKASIVVEHEEWNGVTKARVKWVNKPSDHKPISGFAAMALTAIKEASTDDMEQDGDL